MSNRHHLPPEIYDHIVDFLHDNPDALKQCCLVSKSWVPRTQGHLFSRVTVELASYSKWRKTFPDPANSPAYHTRTLTVDGTLRGDKGSWLIRSFSRVEQLIVKYTGGTPDVTVFLSPYRGLASSLKSLRVDATFFPSTQVLDLIHYLPLLEDLILTGRFISRRSHEQPATTISPVLTGTLDLLVLGGMNNILRPLLSLPSGLRFREINLSCCHIPDLTPVAELVVACSGTLECFDITCEVYDDDGSYTIDLSKAKKLKDVAFRCRTLNCGWVIRTLKTIAFEQQGLQQISIRIPHVPGPSYDRSIVQQIKSMGPGVGWLDLDRLLVQFWELGSIHLRVVCPQIRRGTMGAVGWAACFMPELANRGILNLVDEEPL